MLDGGRGVSTSEPSVDRLAGQHDPPPDSNVRYLAPADRLVEADLANAEPPRKLAYRVRAIFRGAWR